MLEAKNCKKGDVVCYPSPGISVPIFCIGIFDHWTTKPGEDPNFSCSILIREDHDSCNGIMHIKRISTEGWNQTTFFRPSNQPMAKKLLCSILVKCYKKENFNVKEAVLKLQDFDKNWQKKN